MFGVGKKQLVKSLERIQIFYCSYGGPGRVFGTHQCDCKFLTEDGTLQHLSECHCGCPEIREALEIIRAMTLKDFDRLAKKAKIQL